MCARCEVRAEVNCRQSFNLAPNPTGPIMKLERLRSPESDSSVNTDSVVAPTVARLVSGENMLASASGVSSDFDISSGSRKTSKKSYLFGIRRNRRE